VATRACPDFNRAAIGRTGPPHRYVVTEAALQAYAEATEDVIGGPVFAILPVWEALPAASRSVASDEARKHVVHYEQDMLLRRPLVAGMELVSTATPAALLPRPNGTSLVIKTETRTADGELVNEQYVTEFFRGSQADDSVGERAPDHRLDVHGEPTAEVAYRVAEDQTIRYAAASGDDFAIHLDDEFAHRVGLPGRIVHGLCTMAFAGRAVLEAASVASPRAVKRLAVRFSAPLFPGETLTTRVWGLDGGFGFECLNGDGQAVVKDGRAELG
jgi:acyl dehydratase